MNKEELAKRRREREETFKEIQHADEHFANVMDRVGQHGFHGFYARTRAARR